MKQNIPHMKGSAIMDVRRSLVHFPLKGPATWSYNVAFVINLNKLASRGWFTTPWCLCDVTVVIGGVNMDMK